MMRPLYAAPPFLHSPPKAPSRMAKDDPELTIQGDDGDGLRFDQCVWLAEILTLNCGGDAHPGELARPR